MTQKLQCPFFTVPQYVVESGLWAHMTYSQKAVYVVLLWRSERRSSPVFQLADKDLFEKSRVARRTIREVRIRLREFGLIKYYCKPGDSYCYTICDPKTGEPFPEHQ